MISALRKNYGRTLWLTRLVLALTILFSNLFSINTFFGLMQMMGLAIAHEVREQVVLAEENAELRKEYGIKEAPTLVMIGADGFTKISGPSDIKKFCETTVKA